MNQTILVLFSVTKQQKSLLEQAAPEANFIYCHANEVSKELVHSSDIIVGNPPAEFVKDAPHLKLMQLQSAGTNAYLDGVMPLGSILTCASGAYGLAISEHMLAVLLQIYKKLSIYQHNQDHHLWQDEGEVRSIAGCTALIVGLGDIGSEFAKRIKALGGSTIGIRRTQAECPEYLDELYTMDQLDALLPKADVVAMSLPATPQTYHVMDAKRLAMMKQDAVLLNVGRGNAIDTDALCDALNAGHLLGAGLDVTDPEPLPVNHPLWDAKNIYITPHVSGGGHLPHTMQKIVEIAAHNILALQNGSKMISVVDFETGYRTV